MIPVDWRRHHRADGELVGYLAPHDGDEVVLVEVGPENLVVSDADFALVVGAPRDSGDHLVIEIPTDRLRRR